MRRCLEGAWISSAGRFVEEFETAWAAYCGRDHGVAMSNGSAALQAAVAALGLEAGDEVIMPTFTIISCATGRSAPSEPRRVSSTATPERGAWTSITMRGRISGRTRAIMPVHIYGHPVDMDPLLELADGARPRGHRGRSRSPRRRVPDRPGAKHIHVAAVRQLRRPELLQLLRQQDRDHGRRRDGAHRRRRRSPRRLRSLRNLGFEPERRFVHDELGFNFRLTNLQAAVGVAQVERVDETVARKREVAARYTERLRDLDGLQLPVQEPWARNVYWMYGVVVDEETGLGAATFSGPPKSGGR